MVEDDAAAIPYATFPRRLLALCLDVALFVGGAMVFALGTELVPIQALWTVLTGVLMAGIFLYEPLLVSITGGTIGHHALNLRVAKENGGGRLGFFQAFARMCLKGILGILSFFFMGLTRRNQALHDLATRSSVRIKDPAKARATHYLFERAVSPGEVQVSIIRRVLAMLGWGFASFIAMSFATIPVLSDACALQGLCSEAEELALGGVTFVWVLCLGTILLFGWRGQLPGARAKRSEMETEGDV
jgi:uncharacterized RDD family membrane protein YckC